MIKLTLHASFTRTGPSVFETNLMIWTGGFSRIDQVGFYTSKDKRMTKEVSYQYIMFVEAKDCVRLQERIEAWFSNHTNEECIIFELQTQHGWTTDFIMIDRSAWRKAVDSILANPDCLLKEPKVEPSITGYTSGSF